MQVFCQAKLRRIYVALSVQLFNMLGDGLLLMGTTLIIVSKNNASHNLTIFLVSSALSGATTLMLAALLIDQVSRRRVMIGIDLIRIVTASLLCIFERSSCFTTLLVLIGLSVGFSVPVYRPAFNAYVGDVVPEEHRRVVNSFRSSSAKISAIAGHAIAAALASAGLYRTIPLVVIGFAFVSAVTLWFAPDERSPIREASQEREMLAGFHYVRSRPWMLAIIVQGSVQCGFVAAPLAIIAPLWFASRADSDHFGYLAAMEALGAACAAIAMIRLPRTPAWVATPVLMMKVGALAVIAVNAGVLWLFPAYFLMGAAAGVFGSLWIGALQESVPSDRLGRVLAIDALGDSVLPAAGFFLAGVAVHYFAISTVAYIAMGILVASVIGAAAIPGVVSLGAENARSLAKERPSAIEARLDPQLVG